MPSLNTGNAILSNPIKVDSSYNVGIGGAASGSFKLQVTGTGNFTSRLTIGDAVGSSPLVWARSGGATGYLYSDADNVGITNVLDFGAGYEGILLNSSTSAINFYTNGVSTPRLAIASNGAATFSNSVTSSLNGFNTLGAYGFTSYEGAAPSGKNIQFTLAIFNSIDGIYQSSGNTNDFGIWTNGGTSTQPKLYIKNGGNVGIGTTSISGAAKLQVVGGLLAVEPINGNTDIQILLGRGLSSLGTSAGSGITSKINFAFEGSNDNFYQEIGFVTTTANQTRANSAADFYISTKAAGASSPSEKFRITSGGNVGINTDSPDMLLTVDGKTGGGSTINLARFYASKGQSDAAYLQIQGVRHPTLTVQRIVLDAFNGAGSNVPLIFQQGGGNVLIGTTTDNGDRLNVSGATSISGNLGVGQGSEGGSRLTIKGEAANNGTYSIIARNSNNADCFVVRNDGAIAMIRVATSFTTGSAANMFIDSGNGFLYRSTSSLKYKKEVIDYDKGLAEVMSMRPVYYKGKGENDADKQFAGLIAEEIHELGLTEFVQYAEDGTPDALAYPNMIALAFKAIQELNQTVQNQQQQINSLINR